MVTENTQRNRPRVPAQILDLNGVPISRKTPAPRMVRTSTGELIYAKVPLGRSITDRQDLPHECSLRRSGAVRKARPSPHHPPQTTQLFPLLEGERYGDVRRVRREPFSFENMNGSEGVTRMQSVHGVIETASNSSLSSNGSSNGSSSASSSVPPAPNPIPTPSRKRPPSLRPQTLRRTSTSRLSGPMGSPSAYEFAVARPASLSTCERSKQVMGKFSEAFGGKPLSVLTGSTDSLPVLSGVSRDSSADGDEEGDIDMDVIWEEVGREMGPARKRFL